MFDGRVGGGGRRGRRGAKSTGPDRASLLASANKGRKAREAERRRLSAAVCIQAFAVSSSQESRLRWRCSTLSSSNLIPDLTRLSARRGVLTARSFVVYINPCGEPSGAGWSPCTAATGEGSFGSQRDYGLDSPRKVRMRPCVARLTTIPADGSNFPYVLESLDGSSELSD